MVFFTGHVIPLICQCIFARILVFFLTRKLVRKIRYFHIQGIKCHVKKAVLFQPSKIVPFGAILAGKLYIDGNKK